MQCEGNLLQQTISAKYSSALQIAGAGELTHVTALEYLCLDASALPTLASAAALVAAIPHLVTLNHMVLNTIHGAAPEEHSIDPAASNAAASGGNQVSTVSSAESRW